MLSITICKTADPSMGCALLLINNAERPASVSEL